MVPCLLAGALIGRCRPQWINPLATPLVRFGVPLIPHALGGFLLIAFDRLIVSSMLGIDSRLNHFLFQSMIGKVLSSNHPRDTC